MPKTKVRELREAKEPEETEAISESYISIGLGLLVVVVVGILLYNYFTQRGGQPTEGDKDNQTGQEATQTGQVGGSYMVVAGDTLSGIAEKSYNNRDLWTEIAKANNISNPDQLEAGQKLVIPEIPSPVPSPVLVSTPSPSPTASITENTYTVVNGDTLWDIACRAYGDCYAWTRIAQTNKLINPDLIHPGNVLTLPR